MHKKNLPFAVLGFTALALVVGAFVSKADTPKAVGPRPSASVLTKKLELPRSPIAAGATPVAKYSNSSTTQGVQELRDSQAGLSYETVIPRPTKKGYYEPKIVPYPEGKPVAVRGYYRKDGTYVQPHFRSLPRR